MHDAAAVAVLERLRDLNAHVEDLPEHGALAQEGAEVRALDDGHHEEHRPLVPAEVEDGDDAGVVHLGHELGFAVEALLHLRGEQVGRDELHRDFPVQPGIARAIDDAHASAAELRGHVVAVGELLPDQANSWEGSVDSTSGAEWAPTAHGGPGQGPRARTRSDPARASDVWKLR